MSHYSRRFGDIGDRREWLLALLYTPVNGSFGQNIQGRTKLMKGAFLTSQRLKNELDEETDFEFRSDKHGPLDPLVFDTTEKLQEEGKLDIIPAPNNHGGDYYDLTDEGEGEAAAIWEGLSDEEKELLRFIKNRHLKQPLSQILNYVYNQFPEYADE